MKAHKNSVFHCVCVSMRTDLYYCKYKLSINKSNKQLKSKTNVPNKTRQNYTMQYTDKCIEYSYERSTNTTNLVNSLDSKHIVLKLMIVQMKVFGGLPKWNSLTSADSFDRLHVCREPNCCVALWGTSS